MIRKHKTRLILIRDPWSQKKAASRASLLPIAIATVNYVAKVS